MPVVTNESGERQTGHEVIYESRERRTAVEPRRSTEREQVVETATMAGGSSLELIGGGGAVVLAIIGLAGYLPMYMAAIATIAIGGGLLAHGAAASARAAAVMKRAAGRERIELAGGLGSEVFGGASGIVLGILALANIVPAVLLPVAAIVLGGAILLGAPAQPELAKLAPFSDRTDRIMYEAVEGTSGAMALAGAGAIVLGILALLNVGPMMTLVMVAMLAIGGALFFEGSALTARFARHLHRAA